MTSEMYLPARLRSGAPHLLKSELRHLRTLLETERATQASLLARQGAATAADAAGGDDAPDRQMDEALTSHAREVIVEVDAALARIEGGTYGVCEACGDPVPYERLEAVPTTRTCIACSGRGRGFLG